MGAAGDGPPFTSMEEVTRSWGYSYGGRDLYFLHGSKQLTVVYMEVEGHFLPWKWATYFHGSRR